MTGRSEPVVLRLIDDEALLQRELDIIDREAEALRILAAARMPAPKLVAAHYTPSLGRLLMTWVDGSIVIDRAGLTRCVDDLAAVAADIAATPLPTSHRLSPWRSWAAADPQPPRWGDVALWSDAIAFHRSAAAPPAAAEVLLHRDLHPLNILWCGGAPAVVDWVNACVGHPHAELGHCRWNLAATTDVEVADRFLARYLRRTAERGYGDYDPWWDVDSLLDKLPGPAETSAWHAVGRPDLTERHVASASDAFLRSVLRRIR